MFTTAVKAGAEHYSSQARGDWIKTCRHIIAQYLFMVLQTLNYSVFFFIWSTQNIGVNYITRGIYYAEYNKGNIIINNK